MRMQRRRKKGQGEAASAPPLQAQFQSRPFQDANFAPPDKQAAPPEMQLQSEQRGFDFASIPLFASNGTSSPQPIQRNEEDGDIQMKAEPNAIQRMDDEDKDIQMKAESKSEDTPNLTGLPDDLKTGVENLSGYSLNDVRVHYNSPKPAQLQALAYTQGTNIHVAPGQQEHLPHEAWHVVQQMQGRVKPTVQMKGVPINDDEGLEREADVMGNKGLMKKAIDNSHDNLLQESQCKENLAQRLTWSEVYTGKRQEIGLTDAQKPEGVEELDDTVDRNVFAGQTKKGRSGFLWYKDSTLTIK